jgi:hypothetical protein
MAATRATLFDLQQPNDLVPLGRAIIFAVVCSGVADLR